MFLKFFTMIYLIFGELFSVLTQTAFQCQLEALAVDQTLERKEYALLLLVLMCYRQTHMNQCNNSIVPISITHILLFPMWPDVGSM